MIRLIGVSSILLFFSCNIFSQSKPAWNEIFSRINNEVQQHSAAYTTLQKATQTIGHRLTGSANGSKAEKYAYDLLKSYGLEVHYMPFEADSWRRGALTVSINNKIYKAVSLAHSPVKAVVSATVVDMGNGLEEDYLINTGAVKGKIVLTSLGILPGSKAGLNNLHRSEKTALAIKYGAAGIIFFNSVPGDVLLTGTASVTGTLIEIPAVCISNNDGMQLKESLTVSPAVAVINMINFSGKVEARNVIATIKGSALPAEKILIGGHLDSWDLATGAIDNGIGSFSVIDIARTFKVLNLQPERTIEFVLFMGEEEGLLGSKAFVNSMIKENALDKVKYMLNLDMTNNPKGYSATTSDDQLLFQEIGAITQSIDSSFANTFTTAFALHSDHQPFMLNGIPSGWLSGGLSKEALNCYHADCDVFDLVNEQELKNTVKITAMLLYGLSDAVVLKAKTLSDATLKEKLLQSNLKEPLKIAGEWRWKD